ncbi:MAG: hypothetical protein WDO19_31255 [Bacteroidota bacterium]
MTIIFKAYYFPDSVLIQTRNFVDSFIFPELTSTALSWLFVDNSLKEL